MNTTAVGELFDRLGLRPVDDDLESEVAEAKKLLAMDGIHPRRRAVAQAIVDAAGIETGMEGTMVTTDERHESGTSLPSYVPKNSAAAAALIEKIGGQARLEEITLWALANGLDVPGVIRAELQFLDAHPAIAKRRGNLSNRRTR